MGSQRKSVPLSCWSVERDVLLDVVDDVERVRSSKLSDVGDEIIFMAACLFFSGDEVGDCFPKKL